MYRGFVAMLLLSLATSATAQIPPRSISAPRAEVDDAFLSYLHGILYSDAVLEIDGETLAREFPEFVPDRPTPFNDIELLTRTRSAVTAASAEPGQLTIRFSVPLRYEVPVDILGHHPVELQGSRVITFEESIRPSGPNSRAGSLPQVDVPSAVSELLVMTLVSGYMRVDIAPWLDFVSGRLFEDVDVALIALVRYRDKWFALLGGYSPSDRPMTGVLNMQTSRFLVNPPRLLTRLARDLVENTTPAGQAP